MNEIKLLLRKIDRKIITILGSRLPHSKGDKSLDAYSVTSCKFAAKHKQKTVAMNVTINDSGCTSGFFRRHDCFEIPWSPDERIVKVLASGLYDTYQKTATGFVSAIAKRLWHSGFTGITSFAAQVASVINEGDIDLSFSSKFQKVDSVGDKYKRDVEHGSVLTNTPEYVAAMRHMKYAYLQPEVHLRDRIPELTKGEYKKDWHNPDGLAIEEFLKHYRLDPYSKEEIIKA